MLRYILSFSNLSSLPHLPHWVIPTGRALLFKCRCCYVSIWSVVMILIVWMGVIVMAEEQKVLNVVWLLFDSCLPFNLTTTHWWFLWDSADFTFPTLLYSEGDFVPCSSKSGWSQTTWPLILYFMFSVKMAEWEEFNQNYCVCSGNVCPFYN